MADPSTWYSTDRDDRRRIFLDRAGEEWEVREAKNHDYDRRGGYCLIFSSINAVRRVRLYPENWFELEPEKLVELSEGR